MSETGAIIEESLKMLCIVQSHRRPSSRFRVLQYCRPLADKGITLVPRFTGNAKWTVSRIPYVSKALVLARWVAQTAAVTPSATLYRSHFHGSIVSRGIVHGLPSVERLLPKPLILDVDDAIWLTRPMGKAAAIHAARQAALVVAGNRYLAGWFSQYNSNTWLVPTSIDTEQYYYVSRPTDQPFNIGWIGSWATLQYLEAAEGGIARFLAHYPESRLLIVCDRRPTFTDISPERIDFVPWSANTEVPLIQRMDVGIMPMPNNEWTRGKCAAKMLQYLAAGIPCIVSPVGANAEILAEADVGWGAESESDWYDALEEAYLNPSIRYRRGARGRELVGSNYSIVASAPKLAAAIRSVCAIPGPSRT